MHRKAAGLTQVQLAAALKRPQSYVATVERGQRHVDVVTLLEFAEVIGFDPANVVAAMKAAPRS